VTFIQIHNPKYFNLKEVSLMQNEILFYVEESVDGGYEASAVNYSIYTQCEEYDELPDTLRDAVRCHFDEGQTPSLIRIHLVRNEVISV
jgi:hypothetical protein